MPSHSLGRLPGVGLLLLLPLACPVEAHLAKPVAEPQLFPAFVTARIVSGVGSTIPAESGCLAFGSHPVGPFVVMVKASPAERMLFQACSSALGAMVLIDAGLSEGSAPMRLAVGANRAHGLGPVSIFATVRAGRNLAGKPRSAVFAAVSLEVVKLRFPRC